MLWNAFFIFVLVANILFLAYRYFKAWVYSRRPDWYNEAFEMAVDWYADYVRQAKTREQRRKRFVEGEIIMQEMFHHIDCLFYHYATREEWQKMVGADRAAFEKALVEEHRRLQWRWTG